MPGITGRSHTSSIMLYMVIEHFREGAAPKIYERFREKGRMMPEGLEYVSSWISYDLKTCWQVMQASDKALFGKWTRNWDDLMDFEIIPIYTSSEVREKMDSEGGNPKSEFRSSKQIQSFESGIIETIGYEISTFGSLNLASDFVLRTRIFR